MEHCASSCAVESYDRDPEELASVTISIAKFGKHSEKIARADCDDFEITK